MNHHQITADTDMYIYYYCYDYVLYETIELLMIM